MESIALTIIPVVSQPELYAGGERINGIGAKEYGQSLADAADPVATDLGQERSTAVGDRQPQPAINYFAMDADGAGHGRRLGPWTMAWSISGRSIIGGMRTSRMSGNRIGRITPLGVVTEFSAGITAGAFPDHITAGSDGNLWFTEYGINRIGRITPLGVVTEFSAGITAGAGLFDIAAGPDANLWFTESTGNRVGRITTAAAIAPPAIVKAFGASTILLNGSTSLTFTVTNPNATDSLGGIFLTDTLPAGLVVSTPNGLTDNCGGASATAGSGTIALVDIGLQPNQVCTFSVNVTGITLGTKNNVTAAVTSDQGTGGTASASVTVVAAGPVSASNIPTLQQWALWVLGLLMLVSAA